MSDFWLNLCLFGVALYVVGIRVCVEAYRRTDALPKMRPRPLELTLIMWPIAVPTLATHRALCETLRSRRRVPATRLCLVDLPVARAMRATSSRRRTGARPG